MLVPTTAGLARGACALLLLALSSSASAVDRRLLMGEENCRVINSTQNPSLTSTWSGACQSGFASGTGKLEWRRPTGLYMSYEGGMKDGLMHGAGFLERADHLQYEGELADGLFHGKGTRVSWQGYYEGDFKAGEPDGFGKMTFALGGEYEGQWRNGVPHGTGTAHYKGGRTVTAEWINGRRSDNTVAPSAEKHKLKTFNQVTISSAQVPFDKGYAQMNAGEKEAVRASYFLDADDEPAYPLDGTQAIMREISHGISKYAAGWSGELILFVDVDAEGVPTTVSVYLTPTPALGNYAAFHAMKQKYKPALCAGQPCAGKFIVRNAIRP